MSLARAKAGANRISARPKGRESVCFRRLRIQTARALAQKSLKVARVGGVCIRIRRDLKGLRISPSVHTHGATCFHAPTASQLVRPSAVHFSDRSFDPNTGSCFSGHAVACEGCRHQPASQPALLRALREKRGLPRLKWSRGICEVPKRA